MVVGEVKETNLKMEDPDLESSDMLESLHILDTVETLEVLLDDVLETEGTLPDEIHESLQRLREKLFEVVPQEPSPPEEPEELCYKCVCSDCHGHIPIFQHDLKLSLDFHRQTEQHKVALKKKELEEMVESSEKSRTAEEATNNTQSEPQTQTQNPVATEKNTTLDEISWTKSKGYDLKRNDLSSDAKKQMFWNSIAQGDVKLAKSFDDLPIQRHHHTKSYSHSKAPKKKRLYVPTHPNHPKNFDQGEPTSLPASAPVTPPSPVPPSAQHAVNIPLHIDTAAAAANTSQPNFPIHGTDVADATQEIYVQRRLVDPQVLEKLRARTLEYREELELMWSCVKHAEGDSYNNEHITKEGNVFHCHVCYEQLVSPYDVVLHVYGDDHLRDLNSYGCVIQ